MCDLTDSVTNYNLFLGVSSDRLPEEDQIDTEGRSNERARSRDRDMKTNSNNRRRARRPDKAVYIPRVVRHKIDLEQPNLKESSVGSSSDVAKEPLVANQKPEADSTGQSLGDEEFVQLSRSGPSPWPPAWDQTVSFFTSLTLDDEADETCADNTDLPTDATLQQQDVDESLLSEVL